MKRDWPAYMLGLQERMGESIHRAGELLASAEMTGCKDCEAAARKHARRAGRLSRALGSCVIRSWVTPATHRGVQA